LHAGGNLYREISDYDCLILLEESIELARCYPNAIDARPTLIAIPKTDVAQLTNRLEVLQAHYQALVDLDAANEMLGAVSDYFKLYSYDQVKALSLQSTPIKKATSLDEWMIPVAKHCDLDKLKCPLVMVQEYGLNLFRLAASCQTSLAQNEAVNVKLNTKVTRINYCKESKQWQITSNKGGEEKTNSFDYLINAAGFKTGEIDDQLNFKRSRILEFKAAYLTHWQTADHYWPEVIFMGERGTPNGMAQFTPYADNYFQLHAMMQEITLFKDGDAKSIDGTAYPKLNAAFIKKVTKG